VVDPAVLFAGDALARGLASHVYFAPLLVWAVPLLDPGLRRAARRYPQRLIWHWRTPARELAHSTPAIAGKPPMCCWKRHTTTHPVPARTARSAIFGSTSSRTITSSPATLLRSRCCPADAR